MRKKLTAKTVDALPPAVRKRYEVWDSTLPGFGLRVSLSGRKTWFCMCRVQGKARRKTLGTYPPLSLSDAREKARTFMRDVQLGLHDEQEDVPATLGEVMPQFIELYAKPKNRNWHQTERLLHQKFHGLFDKRLVDITRTDVVRILDGMNGRANHALAAIKKLLNWSLDRGMIDVNPVAGLKPPAKIRARDRILSDAEIARFMSAAQAEGYPFGTLYEVLLLTGQGGPMSTLRLPQGRMLRSY